MLRMCLGLTVHNANPQEVVLRTFLQWGLSGTELPAEQYSEADLNGATPSTISLSAPRRDWCCPRYTSTTFNHVSLLEDPIQHLC